MDFKAIYSELRRLYNNVNTYNTKDTIQDLIRCIEDLVKKIENVSMVPTLPTLPRNNFCMETDIPNYGERRMPNNKLPPLPPRRDDYNGQK